MEKVDRAWFRNDFIKFCYQNNYYNAGSDEDFELTLNFIENTIPTDSNIRMVARDIKEHTIRMGTLSVEEIAQHIYAQLVYIPIY